MRPVDHQLVVFRAVMEEFQARHLGGLRFSAALTLEELGRVVSPIANGHPPETVPVRTCLRVVLNEEWEHRLYAERDLAVIEEEG